MEASSEAVRGGRVAPARLLVQGTRVVLTILVAFVGIGAPAAGQLPDAAEDGDPPEEPGFRGETRPDVPYVPTPRAVADRMLEVAGVSEDDRIYDLGSGDGRILIRAARDYGAEGVGYELNGLLVREARENAREAGVADLVEFRREDLFTADLSDATVVTLYLSDSLNVRLRPKLLSELAPGTFVVSHDFGMGSWEPDHVERHRGHHILRWVVPEEIPAFEDESRRDR